MSVKLAFYKGRSHWFDRLVQWWTKSPYSHCELVLDYQIATPSVCASSSWPDSGVRIKKIYLNPEKWDLVDLPSADRNAAWSWFVEHDHDGYDLLSLLGLVVRPIKHNTFRWNCVEACASALGFSDTWRLTVADFYVRCLDLKK